MSRNKPPERRTYSIGGGALPLVADARAGLDALDSALATWAAPADWTTKAGGLAAEWNETVTRATASSNAALPSDAQVLGAVNRVIGPRDVIVCAAGGLPGELHKLWRCREAGTYHVEYGYSCMGYEIAGGLGVKLAMPDREVWVVVGYRVLEGTSGYSTVYEFASTAVPESPEWKEQQQHSSPNSPRMRQAMTHAPGSAGVYVRVNP
jgi:TPP-dependent trihydroxycyclohexane-1,2-dione (THcHDO) dehydratase